MKKIIPALLALMLTTVLAGCEIIINTHKENADSGVNTKPNTVLGAQINDNETKKPEASSEINELTEEKGTSMASKPDTSETSTKPESTVTSTPSLETSTPSVESSALISREKAKQIALNHAGVTDIFAYEIEFDKEHSNSYFEIEFKSGKFEYSYVINAKTGTILDSEREFND